MALPAVPNLVPPLVDVTPERPFYVAMVIDNVVHGVLNLEGLEASRYLAQPVFVQIEKPEDARSGWVYDGTKFTAPNA